MPSSFLSAKKILNPAQRSAVETIFGPVLAIAGPGTGKTQVLALRIAEILDKTDTNPAQILALTFTEAGVTAMRNRLRTIIGAPAHAVRISTFHGFCVEILKRFPEKFLFAKTLETADDLAKIQILKTLLAEAKYENLTPFNSPNYFLREILGKISSLKREAISPEDLAKVVEKAQDDFDAIPDEEKINPKTGVMKGKFVTERNRLEKQQEFSKVFAEYENALKQKGLMDFDDQIGFVVRALKNDVELLATLQEEFLFILSDEFQDSNGAQMQILEFLAGDDSAPNLFVVGDDDQSIYRFQGANLENITRFLGKYPDATKITLTENYRSTDEILSAAKSLISHGTERLSFEKNIASALGKKGAKPSLARFETPEAERFFVIEKVRELLKNGKKPEEIAVLVRTNSEGRELAAYCEKNDISAVFSARSNALSDPIVRRILDLFRLVAAPRALVEKVPFAVKTEINRLFFRVLHAPFFHISPTEIWEAWEKVKSEKGSFVDFSGNDESGKDASDEQQTGEACQRCISTTLSGSEKISLLARQIAKWNADLASKSIAECAEIIFSESGALDYLCRENRHLDSLSHLNALFAEIKNLSRGHPDFSLEDFLENLDLREEFDLGITDMPLAKIANAISILTAHGAKGLEFETVFVMNCTNGIWGDRRALDKIALPEDLLSLPYSADHANEEERRLFFVAMTRAKQNLFLSFSARGNSAKDRSPSRFLDEISPELLEEIPTEKYETEVFAQFRAEILPTRKPETAFEIFLRPILSSENFAISATAFENFRECPRKFLYENIIRIPGVKNRSAALGTAMHRALEIFFAEKISGRTLSISEVLADFSSALRREILTEQDFADAEKEGQNLLRAYFNFYGENFAETLATERDFRGDRVFLGEVPITGKIDKIEKMDDHSVRIVDYKTAKAKSENEIFGRRDSQQDDPRAGSMGRQLQFYFLLTRNSTKFPFCAESFCLDFLRPDTAGKFIRREFSFDEKSVEPLKNEIIQMYDDIRTFRFLDVNIECAATQKHEKCEWCEMFFGEA